MADGVEIFLKILGLGTPFVYAAGTYGFFQFLDEKASDPAKKAISDWLKPVERDNAGVRAAVIELFDKIYGKPLLSLRAFKRSSVISIVLTGVYFLAFDLDLIRHAQPGHALRLSVILPYLGLTLVFNALTDYGSLFIVRRLLRVTLVTPMTAMIVGATVGALIVLMCFIFRMSITGVLEHALGGVLNAGVELEMFWDFISGDFIRFFAEENAVHNSLIIPALFVHIWLPVTAFGVVGVRLISYFGAAVEKMRWFLKQGDEHPLSAVGYVAAAGVFIAATATTILGRVLS